MRSKKAKRFSAFLTAILACIMIPLPASAWTDAGGASILEDNETSISMNVSMTAGKEKDLSGFIQYRYRNEDAGVAWYLSGTIRWASSNPDIVSVNEKGVAMAHRVGAARITATGWDNLGVKHVQTVVVGVSRASGGNTANSFEISEGSWLDLRQLGELQSGAKAIGWSSSVPGVASVDSDGLVLVRSIGRCVISASYADESGAAQTIKYQLRVTSAMLSDKANESSFTMKKGDNLDLGSMFYPNYQNMSGVLKELSCASGNQDVVSVSGLSAYAKNTGVCSVSVRRGEDEDEILCHRLKITVTR